VCSDTSSLPEVAGEGALLVDPEDTAAIAAALRRVAEDGALRSRLVARGRANLKRFDWRIAAGRVFELLEQATNRA
jgi:glycosyltransferase involved in cell wall biosynthesis